MIALSLIGVVITLCAFALAILTYRGGNGEPPCFHGLRYSPGPLDSRSM